MNFSDVLNLGTLIVTSVGFFMLYVTFRLQTQTFQSQLEVTRIEQRKFLLQIRPNFEVVLEQDVIDDYDYITIGFKLTNAIARNIVIGKVEIKTHNMEQREYGTKVTILAVDSMIMGGAFKVKRSFEADFLRFPVRFEDEVGTQYEQILHGVLKAPKISPPQIISNK